MKNFTLSVYAFHLRQSLTDASGEVDKDADRLWKNLVNLGNTHLPFPELKDLKSKLICYEKGNYRPKAEASRINEWLSRTQTPINLTPIDTGATFKIKGTLAPFLLHDTYAVDLTLSVDGADEIDFLQLKYFQPKSLLPTSLHPSLGQTLWIYGEVQESDEECLSLATALATQLLYGTHLILQLVKRKKVFPKLFGSLFFEFEAISNLDNPAETCHIVVSLNNTQAPTVYRAQLAYNWQRDLLCCRQKILWVTQQARKYYKNGRDLYSGLHKKINTFKKAVKNEKTRLETFTNFLAEMPEDAVNYNSCIQGLQTHYTTISTNAKNYRRCLEGMEEGGEDVEVWKKFHQRTETIFLAQIEIDLSYLSPGKDLFERLITSIRGIVEIDQAKRDRDRQKTEKKLKDDIEAIGVGIAVGAIVASSSGLITIDWRWPTASDRSWYPHPFLISIFLSLLVAGLAWWGMKCWQNRNKSDG